MLLRESNSLTTVNIGHQHVKEYHLRLMIAFQIRLFSLFLFSLLSTLSRPAPILLHHGEPISMQLFEELEELARIVDIAYCVGSTGIQKPFECLSRCNEFQGFELVTTWNTGPLLSDSCGYIAVSHEPFEKRVLVAFRGTYSIANTIADLSTSHAEYVPFPTNNDSRFLCAQSEKARSEFTILPHLKEQHQQETTREPDCPNCTIHKGFLTSWQNTRCAILPHVEKALADNPDYKLVLVGHSLGGAVAAVGALEFQARGYQPHVTTFGEPRIGNHALNQYIDRKFNLGAVSVDEATFRRVTHVGDPVPLLPLEEWGYEMHAGEIYISKSSLPTSQEDIHICEGDADLSCIAGADSSAEASSTELDGNANDMKIEHWGVPSRYKLWQLFFAHRDYFWRLGICAPIGDHWDWWHPKLQTDVDPLDMEL